MSLERDAGLAGGDHLLKVVVQSRQGRVRQIDRLRQVEAEELPELMTEHGVHLGLCRGGRQDVRVPNALALLELHREQDQRRRDPLLLLFLEVVPTQKAERETQLGKPELGSVAALLGANAIEDAWQVRRVLEAKVAAQRKRLAVGERVRDLSAPRQE